jgi:hypothetical protein
VPRLYAVSGTSVVHFVNERAYVLPGDHVIGTSVAGDDVCVAFYGGPLRRTTTGWLPRRRLVSIQPAAATMVAWAGGWAGTSNGNEQSLTIRRAGRRLAIVGVSTWNSGPASIARGDVRSGFFKTLASPSGNTAHLVPADSPGCIVRLWLFGVTLVAADNGKCGGLNVTFSGFYHRGRSR